MKKKILCAALLAVFALSGCQHSSESEDSSGSSSSSRSTSSSSSSSSSFSSSSSSSTSSDSTGSAGSESLESSSSSEIASSTSKQSSASSTNKPKPASSSEKPVVQEPITIDSYNQREQTASEAEFCEEVFELTNQQRAKYGLEPFKEMDKLSELAVARAWENTVKYGHKRPDGKSCFTILGENGLKYSAVAENVAMGQYTPADVVNAWMNSDGHRGNILNPDYEYMGVGFYYENNSRFWTQIFYTP